MANQLPLSLGKLPNYANGQNVFILDANNCLESAFTNFRIFGSKMKQILNILNGSFENFTGCHNKGIIKQTGVFQYQFIKLINFCIKV